MSNWAKKYIKFAVRTFWGTLIIGVIALAVAIQLGRLIFPVLEEYRRDVEDQLSAQLQVDISIGALVGEWQGLRPKMSLDNLEVRNPSTKELIFKVESVVAEVSLLSSLRDWRPAIRQLEFIGLEGGLQQLDSGAWQVRGLPKSTASTPQAPPSQASPEETEPPQSSPIIDDPLDLFLFGRRISLRDTRLTIDFRNELSADITIPTIGLENDADFHRLVAEFQIDRGERSLKLVVEGVGDPRDEEDFIAKGYLNLDEFPTGQVLAALGISEDQLLDDDARQKRSAEKAQGSASVNLWFTGSTSKGLDWLGDLSLQGVPLLAPEGVLWPTSLEGKFKGHWDSSTGWEAAVSSLNLEWNDYTAPEVNAELLGRVGEPAALLLDRVDLALWHKVLQRAGWLPKPMQEAFSELQPYGTLTQVKMSLASKANGYFNLQAHITEGGVHNWAGVPAIEQVNGLIESTAFDGHVILDSQNGFKLNFPHIYKHPLTFETASGDVRWQVDLPGRSVGLSSGLLEVSRTDVAAKGYFNLRLPFKSSPGNEPEMTLAIGIEQGFVDMHRMLVPYTVPEDLYSWLGRSIKSGTLSDGAFIYHGTLMKDSELPRVLQLSALTKNAQLEFDPSWPKLDDADSRILLDDSQFNVSDLNATMKGVRISNGSVTLEHLGAEEVPAINIKGDIQGSSEQSLDLLTHSPIKDLLGEEVMSWKMRGPLKGTVDLLVPLVEGNDHLAQQFIDLKLSRNRLRMPSLDLEFSDINSVLHYDHKGGVRIEHVKATLWQQPIEAHIKTQAYAGNNNAIEVDFNGHLDVQNLRQWSGRPELAFFVGEADASGNITIPLNNKEPITFTAQSDLVGVKVNLPAPLQKNASAPAEFELELTTGERNNAHFQDILMRYTHNIEVQALVSQVNDALYGVSIHSGGQTPELHPGVIMLQGDLAEGDAIAWYDSIDEYVLLLEEPVPTESALASQEVAVEPTEANFAPSVGDPFEESALPVRGQFHWQKLHLDSLVFSDVTVDLEENNAIWQFDVSSPDIAGRIIYAGEDKPLKADLTHLHLHEDIVHSPAPTSVNAQAPPAVVVEAQSSMEGINIFSLPAAEVSIEQWSIDARDYGSIRFDLIPVSGGVAAYNLNAKLPNMTVSAERGGAQLIWLRSAAGDTTYIEGSVTAGDIGNAFTAWGYDKALTSKSVNIGLQIQWPGPPDMLALNTISGAVDIDLQRGRFIRGAEVGENPLVKLVGLLNFDTLVRRMRMDFSDLHPEGMGYELVSGNMIFKQGTVRINDPLFVDMPASQLQLVGVLDLEQELMDATLVATLPLAGNLTFAAALTGGIPMAVGIFVAGKLLKNQMDKVSSLKYRVYGEWEDPKLKLEKAFNNETDDSRN